MQSGIKLTTRPNSTTRLVNNFAGPSRGIRRPTSPFSAGVLGTRACAGGRTGGFDHERPGEPPVFVRRPTNYTVNAVFYRHRVKSFAWKIGNRCRAQRNLVEPPIDFSIKTAPGNWKCIAALNNPWRFSFERGCALRHGWLLILFFTKVAVQRPRKFSIFSWHRRTVRNILHPVLLNIYQYELSTFSSI